MQWYRRQQHVLLASQRARWEHEQATLAHFTVSESFTLGWLNVLLRHLWPTVIEQEVAEVAAANIRVRWHCSVTVDVRREEVASQSTCS